MRLCRRARATSRRSTGRRPCCSCWVVSMTRIGWQSPRWRLRSTSASRSLHREHAGRPCLARGRGWRRGSRPPHGRPGVRTRWLPVPIHTATSGSPSSAPTSCCALGAAPRRSKPRANRGSRSRRASGIDSWQAVLVRSNISEALTRAGFVGRAAALIDPVTEGPFDIDRWPVHLERAHLDALRGHLDAAHDRLSALRDDSASMLVSSGDRGSEGSRQLRRPG